MILWNMLNPERKVVLTVKIKKPSTLILTAFLALQFVLAIPLTAHAETMDEAVARQEAKTIQTNQITNWPVGPTVTADSAILMDANTGAILYAKDIHAKQYPASTTKILTALIAAEKCSMDETVHFSYDAVHSNPPGGSHIAIDAGEELTMEQSLSAILIASANEVSFAVAEHVSGGESWEDFIPLMNERAQELGCLNSNFVNPNGLPDDNHYTTAYDLAMIGKAFFSNELLCKYASTRLLHIPPAEHQPDDIYAATTNELFANKKYPYEHIVASKTGYTDSAKSCLVSCAEKDGLKLICVVLHDYAPRQYLDTIALFDYGFANFETVNVSSVETKYNVNTSGFFYSEIDIFGSSKPILSLNTQDCITLPKTVDFSETQSSISYNTMTEDQVAAITYTYQGHYIGEASVDLASDSQASYTFDSGIPSQEEPAPEEEPSQGNVIFINVIKVILWVLGIAGGLILITLIVAFLRNYHFALRRSRDDTRTRRGWQKNRKRRRKRAKRPSRFRDYDF
ncbi:MAG: D-alanyl-D-alanine carboxypeptidase [Lachnospiraceae bacterium]|nr:D-alanyl-D-alanine carboxypeptidase [Lachnospiraceae bacterium]